jgi:hypothetical protein
MRYKLMRFQAHDLHVLLPNAFPYSTGIALEGHKSYTLFFDDEVVGCAGTLEHWPGRHSAWAYFNRNSGGHMVAITRFTQDRLSAIKGRVEMTVQKDFTKGHKWAKLLGFEVETPLLVCYGPKGEDHVGYVKFQE